MIAVVLPVVQETNKVLKARFKRLILHAPNRIGELNACKMHSVNQLNVTYFN